MITKLTVQVGILEASVGDVKSGQADLRSGQTELRQGQAELYQEISTLRVAHERLCTLLEGIQKQACHACTVLSNDVIEVKANVEEMKSFHNKLIGGALVLSVIGTGLGIIGGWVLSIYFHYHGGADSAAGFLHMGTVHGESAKESMRVLASGK